MLDSLYYVTFIAAFVCCIFTYKSLDQNFKWFLPFLAFGVVYNFPPVFQLLIIRHTNAWCNNFEDILEFICYATFIMSFEKRAKRKKHMYIVAGIIIVLSVIDIFWIQGFWKRATIAIVTQNLFGLWLICSYYYRLLNDDNEEYIELMTYPPFLAVTGIFFYYLAMTFYYSCFSFMVYKNNYHFYLIAATLLDLNSLIINGLFSFSFICFFRKNSLSS
ncbi:hypothetical protein MTO98_01025 [Mucilaginibacter sp. SMC90]|uniref:hypothetical protein n=1 Tax=Mucilaginibacter sp. SMC90 TaxID=2929803 RepID=UPI001FB27C03|nr:hypothetical protein [Mucilaginibacter sp. SMC90]UOE49651.1 hypothetical protein MTO98_01025 [Mucilaginibacter sp. SMC90]